MPLRIKENTNKYRSESRAKNIPLNPILGRHDSPERIRCPLGSALDGGLSMAGNIFLSPDKMPNERKGQHCQQPDSQPWTSRGHNRGGDRWSDTQTRGSCVPTHYAQINFIINCTFRAIGNECQKEVGWSSRGLEFRFETS